MSAAAVRATDSTTAELDARGWTIIRGAADPALMRTLAADLARDIARTPFSEGLFYGSRTRRFGRLLSRSLAMPGLVLEPSVLTPVKDVVGRHHAHVGLNLTQLIAVSPDAPAQVPHRDDEMWPLSSPSGEHLVNVLWPLTPFRADNGATRVWTGSHRGSATPASDQPDVAAMEPGDALVVLGSTLHAQGANVSDEVRTCVVVGYQAAWLLPGENPWLSYPPEEVRTWPKQLAELAGYRRLPPNLNGVDCRCPSELLFEAGSGAVDVLWPRQEEGLRRHYGTRNETDAA